MDKEARKPSSKTASSKDKRHKDKDKDKAKDDSKVHKLSLKGSSRLVAEFVCPTRGLDLPRQLVPATVFLTAFSLHL